jgi:hypothetical protein
VWHKLSLILDIGIEDVLFVKFSFDSEYSTSTEPSRQLVHAMHPVHAVKLKDFVSLGSHFGIEFRATFGLTTSRASRAAVTRLCYVMPFSVSFRLLPGSWNKFLPNTVTALLRFLAGRRRP